VLIIVITHRLIKFSRQGLTALVILFSVFYLLGCEKATFEVFNVEVSGTIRYEDKELNTTGVTGNTKTQPVRYAFVDLVNMDDRILDSGVSDEQGAYKLQGKGAGLLVRVVAATSFVAGTMVRISDYNGNTYAVSKDIEPVNGAQQLDIAITIESKISGVYNMLDVFTNAVELIGTVSSKELPVVNAFWEPQKSHYGTYFCPTENKWGSCPQGKGMYILGGNANGGDTDEYDDDVLWHEFSHYLESFVGVQDSPGGTHYLTQNDYDLRLAWSEGWGGFFPTAVKRWLALTNSNRLSQVDNIPLSLFIDTFGNFAGISINMANPNPRFCAGSRDCFVYSSNEVAVAKVLTGLHQTFGMQTIWEVFSGYMPNNTVLPATLETFWDGWLQQQAPGGLETGQLQTIFNDRQIYYQADGFEFDDDIEAAKSIRVCFEKNCAGELRYLYKSSASDADLLSFNAVVGNNYTIETFGLSNGADTYLRLLDSYGNVVTGDNGAFMANNDRVGTVYCYSTDSVCRVHNDKNMLSSMLQFMPQASGIYYLEVTSNTNRPIAAGRYGTYWLRIVQK